VSDTFFTASPHWGWYIVLYFFIGGIAGGAFFIASLLRLFGRAEDLPVVRIGHQVAFVGAAASGLLLTLDLTRPERFWHMLIQSHTGLPMFKLWSPMSVGAWGLLVFALFATAAALGDAAQTGRPVWRPLRWRGWLFLTRRVPVTLIALAGSAMGFFLAGYTGVLLSVTSRPIWADSDLLGLVFIISAASTGAASLDLLARRRSGVHQGSLDWLARFDRQALLLELVAVAAFVASLGSVARVFVGWWGVVLLLGVVGAGIVVPFTMKRAARPGGHHQPVRTAVLVLAGGFLLRVVVLFASSGIEAVGAGVTLR
jgi:formate-dependent nitrite reductase membrane component NrfD